jgi:hypothetical protein
MEQAIDNYVVMYVILIKSFTKAFYHIHTNIYLLKTC